MSLFGALVRTAINVAMLPVTVPVAIAKGAIKVAEGEPESAGKPLAEVVKRLKREADEDSQ